MEESENDPFGRAIFSLRSVCDTGSETYEDVANVIRRPALVIEIKEDPRQLFFYRSVNWHETMLIGVHLQNQQWRAFSCTRNPASDLISGLLKRGKQLI